MRVGHSIAEAFNRMYNLNNACQVQVDTMQTGGHLIELPTAVCELTARQYAGEEEENMAERLGLEWRALLRLIDQQKPDYRT